MKQYQVIFESEQPLMLGDRVTLTGNVLESDSNVPGATLRGAVAYELLQFMNAENPWFQEAFVTGKLSIGDAYPIHANHKQGLQMFGPTPFTALSCKRFDGLQDSAQGQRSKHGVVDDVFRSLPDTVIKDASIYKTMRQRKQICNHRHQTGTCQNNRKRFSKGLSKANGHWHGTDLKRINYTRTALEKRTGSVAPEQLYTLECLDRGNLFATHFKFADGLDDQILKAFVDHWLRVGNGRTRGLGKIKILSIEPCQRVAEDLAQRVDQFQKRALAAGLDCAKQTWFTVDLQTPLQALDAFLNPRLSLATSDFAPFFENCTVTLVSRHVRHIQRGGWNALLNIPKPTLPMQAPGSVYLLKVSGGRQHVLAGLQRLQQYGLGENFAEGYGHVMVCHPFHIDPQTATGGTPR